MFKKIYVPVDNSEYANQAIEMALALARPWNASIVGSHVYAAKMHDYRFKQMEYRQLGVTSLLCARSQSAAARSETCHGSINRSQIKIRP